jgi:hypothetical protein
MGLFNGLWLAVLGLLGASNLVVAKRPDAKYVIAKLAPYQGWIGAVSALWGVWGVLQAILNLRWFGYVPVYYLAFTADAVLSVALGLLLGVGVLKTFIKHPQAVAKLDQAIARLAPKQGTLGVIALGVAAWMIVASFMWHV